MKNRVMNVASSCMLIVSKVKIVLEEEEDEEHGDLGEVEEAEDVLVILHKEKPISKVSTELRIRVILLASLVIKQDTTPPNVLMQG